VKSLFNKNVVRSLLLPGILLTLSSCSVFQGRQEAASTTPQQSQAIPRAVTATTIPMSQTPLPTETDSSAEEQRALLEQINRDGAIPDFVVRREQTPTPVDPTGEDVVELNYEQAELRLILEELADALDITMIIDPSIDDRVSIRTSQNRPLTQDDIWPLIRLLTQDAQITVERIGNVFNARKTLSNFPVEIVTPSTAGTGTASIMMQVTPLTYISPSAAIEVLQPLVEPEGTVSLLGNSNIITVTGTSFKLERVNQLLEVVDSDPFASQGIQLFQLNNASATEVATELEEILLLIEGPNPAYQVRGIERINSILVTAPANRGFDDIRNWVAMLDADSQEQVEQLFHYKVRNLNAEELSTTLSDVFEAEEDFIPLATDEDGQLPPLFSDGGDEDVAQEPLAAPGQGGSGAVSADLNVRIVADAPTNSLLIRGTLRDYRQLLTIISQLDAVPLQVLINAAIAQITLTDDTQFGVDWSRVAADAALDPISTSTSTEFLPAGGIGGLLFTKTFLDGAARVDATLEAIAVNNDVELLARPSLTVINNQEGEIQIGSQVPVQQGESQGFGGNTVSNIVYRDTGIVLTVTPQINDDGVVNLTIRQELSSLGALGINNNPIFDNQEISTTVVVRDGENVVLGGLIQSQDEDLNTGVPGLHRIPVLGRLFSFESNNLERRELLVVIRPEVIDLNAPSTVEFSQIRSRFELASALLEESGL